LTKFKSQTSKKMMHSSKRLLCGLFLCPALYNELGIPAVKIGPRGKRIGPRAEEIQIDDRVKAAKIYALVALDICSRERR
jgi:hypothetical protein